MKNIQVGSNNVERDLCDHTEKHTISEKMFDDDGVWHVGRFTLKTFCIKCGVFLYKVYTDEQPLYQAYKDDQAKDWKIVGKEEEKRVLNKDGCGRHFLQDYCDCGEPEEEEPNTKVICNMCGWTDEGEYFMGAVTGSGAQYGPHKGCSKNGILKEEEPKGHMEKVSDVTIDIIKRKEVGDILENLVHRGSSPYSDVKDLIEETIDDLLKALKAYEE